jgi:predicted pyridoxine 5'-phosphate oxidase superfamily flavin-nucleotide-binding protein
MSRQPFHPGEIAIQQRAGERDAARRNGVGIAAQIPAGARPFLSRQRLIALSAAGDDRHLWTSVWCGEPGFVHSTDTQRLTIERGLTAASNYDPVLRRLASGRPVGTVVIDLATRRRLRINGIIETLNAAVIDIHVHESVGNCPKYIQRRELAPAAAAMSTEQTTAAGVVLDDTRRAVIERADTAFVGSVHQERGLDTSHRGGAPGFIHVADAATLRIPDYPGNSMFMTLGNFEVDPRASIAVLDFEAGAVVALSGSAHLHADGDRLGLTTGGTGRWWDFAIREWQQFAAPALRASLIESSPYNPIVCTT